MTPGSTYYYWIEDVDLNGVVTRHGPVSATFGAPTAVTLSGISATPAAASALPWLALAVGAGVAVGLGRLRRRGNTPDWPSLRATSAAPISRNQRERMWQVGDTGLVAKGPVLCLLVATLAVGPQQTLPDGPIVGVFQPGAKEECMKREQGIL